MKRSRESTTNNAQNTVENAKVNNDHPRDFAKILKLSGKELYDESQIFKRLNDYDNYWIYLTMSANYNYERAQSELDTDLCKTELHLKQNHLATIKFYEATKEYHFSKDYLNYMHESVESIIQQRIDNIDECVKQEYSKQKESYEKAIEQGDINAMNDLAIMYRDGAPGIRKDRAKALELFKLAGDKGNIKASSNYKKMFLR